MPKGKKRTLDENEDEYKTANARFKNPFHTTLDYTLTSASAESSRLDTVQETRTVAYNPPTKPVLVEIPQLLNMSDLPDSVSPDSQKKTQSSVLLDQFGAHFDEIQNAILAIEYDDTVGTACSCGVVGQTRTCRCLDCFQSPVTCQQCFVQMHRAQPFHWVEQWNGNFFVRQDISALGQPIALGHNGELCHNISKATLPLDFLVVHTNGIHRTKALFCGCVGCGSRMQQLLKARLFPATTEQPTTAFTFGVLREFHLHGLESVVAAHGYMAALRRLTDNTFTADIPDLQSQLVRVARIWKAVTMQKRSGQLHGIDRLLPHRKPGSIVVPCPACPEPFFNMDKDWKATPQDMRHINQLFIAEDGCHKFQKKKKNGDPDDVSLLRDNGYFPDDKKYKEYIAVATDSTEKSTCAYINVVNSQNKTKFKSMEITGVVACSCRHGVLKSMVDLQKGEKFANADYALAMALRQHPELIYILHNYDIACQHCIKLRERFAKYFPDLLNQLSEFQQLVPSLHIHGHIEDCQFRYNLAYHRGAGRTHGENLEGIWGAQRPIGGMTKEMNNGHRHDILNDYNGDWNWLKVQQMARSLYRGINNGHKFASTSRTEYLALSEMFGKERVSEWGKQGTAPELKNGEWTSAYRHPKSKVPDQASVCRNLLAEELKTKASSLNPTTPIVTFINMGIEIQQDQRALHQKIKQWHSHRLAHTEKEILNEQNQLRLNIVKWRKVQVQLMPQLGDSVAELPLSDPHEERLCIPSDFNESRRDQLKISHLVDVEMRLREGEAQDALRDLRMTVRNINTLTFQKQTEIRGQEANLRSNDAINKFKAKRHLLVLKYNAARSAMIALGCLHTGEDDDFPPLTESDATMKNSERPYQLGDGKRLGGPLLTAGIGKKVVLPNEPGSRRQSQRRTEQAKSHTAETKTDAELPNTTKKDSWIWRVGPAGKGDSVQWHRARALVERWDEDVEILEEEFRRNIRSFEKMSQIWLELGHSFGPSGRRAYALQKSSAYARMAKESRILFEAAGGMWPAEGESLFDHIRHIRKQRPRPFADKD